MLFMLLAALLAAKLKKYKLSYLSKAYTLLPYAALELFYITVQVMTFCGVYLFIPYAEIIKKLYFAVLLLPIIRYRLYVPALIGSGSVIAGTLLNRWVIAANGGKMPVYATLSNLTGYFNPAIIGSADSLHSIGNAQTQLKILTDYIDLGFCVLSIGDLFIHAFTFIIIYSTIKTLNFEEGNNKNAIG